jgi:hypothetical protein
MFFEEQYPFLHPIIIWTFRIYVGALVAFIVGIVVVGPGIYAAKEIYEAVSNPQASTLETRLTQIWSIGAGLLLSALLGGAIALIVLGILAEVKLWFIGICWTLLMLPWLALGLIIRRFAMQRKMRAMGMGKKMSGWAGCWRPYSFRKTTSGSTFAARRAGTKHAKAATARRIRDTTATVGR